MADPQHLTISLTPLESPSMQQAHAMAYDQHRKVVIMYGNVALPSQGDNRLYETWEYDGVTWIQK